VHFVYYIHKGEHFPQGIVAEDEKWVEHIMLKTKKNVSMTWNTHYLSPQNNSKQHLQ
jgi:hypothetical protein